MNINKYKVKLISYMLCLSMLSGNFLTANAAEIQTAKDNDAKSSDSNYSVIVPKTVTLDKSRRSEYSVTVTGDIPCSKCVYVSPVDGIAATENLDFYMRDQTLENGKSDVVATITQNKVYWNYEEVSNAYKETGSVSADNLSAGTWRGTFEIAISLVDDPSHKHQYTETITKEPSCTEEGEKTYTCECGDCYTEKIPATGHNYGEDDKCEDCEKLDPNHKHQYTETITKEPSCTEEGEKTYTCECGDSYTEKIPATGEHKYTETITKEPTCTENGEKTYTCEHCNHTYTEVIPATGHNFVDGECTNCGEADPNYHEWVPLYFRVSGLPSTKTADALTSGVGKTQSTSDNLTITIPEWYPTNIAYTYTYSYQYSGYTSGSVQCGSFSTSRSSTKDSSSQSNSGSKEIILKPGNNIVTVSARCTSDSTKGSGYRRWLIRGTFPSLSSLLDKTQHYCVIHGEYEEHYTSCMDDTRDEYYFCEVCGLQFRHRCKFDDANISFANCTGGDMDLVCIDDYYDTKHDLFTACGETSTVHFDGLGHDWKPYIVQVNPVMTINPNSHESKYTFTKLAGTADDTYTGSISIADGANGSSSCSMSLEITLPDNFNGTYTMPITYSISSSSFTKSGYRMTANCTNNYMDDNNSRSQSYLSYNLGYNDSSIGTTSGTMNVELHPGKNVISFSTSASTNLSSWQTGSNGGPAGSVRFRVPHTPFYIFKGNEVHKCDRCNIEENHTDKLYQISRVESDCTNTGYIRYTCDECGVIYDEIIPINENKHTDEDNNHVCDLCGEILETHIWKVGRTTDTNIKNIVGEGFGSLTYKNFILGMDKMNGGGTPSSQPMSVEPHISLQIKLSTTLQDGFSYNSSTGKFTSDRYWICSQIPHFLEGYTNGVINLYEAPVVYVTDGPVMKASSDNLIKTSDGVSRVYELPDSASVNVRELMEDSSFNIINDNFIVLVEGFNGTTNDYSEIPPNINVEKGYTHHKVSSFNISYNYDDTTGVLTVNDPYCYAYLTDYYGNIFRTLKAPFSLKILFVTDPSTLGASTSSMNTVSFEDDGFYYSEEGISISIDDINNFDENETKSFEETTSTDETETNNEPLQEFETVSNEKGIETEETVFEEESPQKDNELSTETNTSINSSK